MATKLMNGQIPDVLLAALVTPGRARNKAAKSFNDMRIAAAKDGIVLKTTNSLQTYRTDNDQVKLFLERYQTKYCQYAPGKVDAKLWRGQVWYRKPGMASAAKPGTSNHGWGLALDFQDLGGFSGKGYAWMKKHAGKYGWNNVEGKSINEPWHWVYVEANDKHKTPKPPTPVEDDVPTIKKYRASKTKQPVGTVIKGSGATKFVTVDFADDPKKTVNTLSADDKNGAKIEVKLSLASVPEGSTVQARAYRVFTDASGGASLRDPASNDDFELIERPGTDGNTQVDFEQTIIYKKPTSGKKSTRIRVELQVILPKGSTSKPTISRALCYTTIY